MFQPNCTFLITAPEESRCAFSEDRNAAAIRVAAVCGFEHQVIKHLGAMDRLWNFLNHDFGQDVGGITFNKSASPCQHFDIYAVVVQFPIDEPAMKFGGDNNHQMPGLQNHFGGLSEPMCQGSI
jgi:hypothetical protein